MPLKSRATGVQAPAAKPETKPVTNRASRQATPLDEGAGTAADAQEGASQPQGDSRAPADPPVSRRGRPAANPGAPKPTRQPRQQKVAADGGEPVENPKAKLRELESQAKQLLKDESAAIAEVTAEFRDKRRALQQEHARITQLASKALFGG